MKAYQSFSTRKTPQSEPIPGVNQVKNSAGGYIWAINDWKRLERFLILGSEGGTYYIKQRKLTRDNAEAVLRCVKEDGLRVVSTVVEISHSGRAPKNDPALFALAMCLKLGDLETRQAATRALPRVARIGTHLFHFVAFLEQFGGWGRLTKSAIAGWYNGMNASKLAYQVVKYQQRDGWANRDLLRLSHPKPPTDTHNAIYHWVVNGWESIGQEQHPDEALRLIWALEKAKQTESTKEIIGLIRDYGLTREMIPTQFLNDVGVWDALLNKMPMTAMIRSLGKMTSVGLLKPMSDAVTEVIVRLHDETRLKKARVHPLSVLVALKIYQQGHGMRGKLSWSPLAEVIDSLDDAFYLSFSNVEPMNKRTMLALDVSGSMTWNNISGMPITPREASAAMAMVTARVEPMYVITAFSRGLTQVSLSPRQRLDDIVKTVSSLHAGGTDCALPMMAATRNNLNIDTFIVYTDNETWAGRMHPYQALQEYRQKTGIPAKLAVVGMVSNKFSIANPDDAGMLDVIGFDTTTPNIITGFARE